MPEYIEREALLKDIDDLKKSPWYNDDYGNGTRQARHDGVNCVVDLCIKQAPAADVVEVVRCKDCEYAKEYKNNLFCCYYPRAPKSVSSNDYCSYGTRKDGEQNGL